MAKSVLVLMATGVLLVPVLCYFAALATPGRPYGGAGAPIYVGGGVRPVIARPGIYRAPVIYRPPVVVQKVIQPVIIARPVAPILAG
uniref:Uncharacterized protein n=1 Tax=Anopheles merus TaxID=30066 RepID=A0A182VK55_ANOME